jgi:hypothetical protein
MRFITDGKRHLICLPYSISGLHLMASSLKIDQCFYHYKNKKTGRVRPHYDIPLNKKEEIESQCEIMTDKEITLIINEYIKNIYRKDNMFKK